MFEDLICALLLSVFAIPAAQAQNPAADVVMVLPFENTSNRAEYNWVGESFADSLSELLSKPGLIVVSSGERELAYQQLRLPGDCYSFPGHRHQARTPGQSDDDRVGELLRYTARCQNQWR